MRVAQRMISRNYRRQVNSSLKKQADTLERSESGLKFKRLSDNVAAGSRAMHLQEERYQATQQLENTKDLIAEMKSVDSNMDSIHSVLQKVQERMLMGMSEDYGATARAVIAKEIHSAKDQILQFVNNQFGGKYLFAGTNNSVQPFTTNAEGKVQYNGIPVEQIWKSTEDGKYYYDKPKISEEGDWVKITSAIPGDPVKFAQKVSVDEASGMTIYRDSAGTEHYQNKDGEWFSDLAGTLQSAGITFENVTVQEYTDSAGATLYASTDASGVTTLVDTNGTVAYTKDADGNWTDAAGAAVAEEDVPTAATEKTLVPNSADTYADIGLGLKISSDMVADTRTAFQVSFSGLTLMGFAGYDKVTPVEGKQHGTEVASNVYDLLTQIEGALTPVMDKYALDDMFTQLVELTDNVGLTRTDLGNRMQYLEQTEDRLKDDINDMTTLETDLISSDPAEEAIKMKECEYVWLAVMQLGSKILPASLLDFMS